MSEAADREQLPASMDLAKLVPWLASGGWRARLRECLHRLLGIYSIYQVFSKARDNEESGGENLFLGIINDRKMQMDMGDFPQRIPQTGSAVVVANHAFGGADAISLTGACAGVRPDTKVLANSMVSGLPGMDKWSIPLHIMGEDGAAGMNRTAMKASLDHLRGGGVLVVFPAGAVSRWRNDLARIADPEWSPHIVRLAMKTGSPVLPVRYFGENPLWFELLGTVHPMMRSALIIRAFLAMKGKSVTFRASRMINHESLTSLGSAEEATRVMRDVVESLGYPDITL